MQLQSCLVVGAGLSGLLAAQRLQKTGWEVTVIDKGRGVGGRMATRRFDGAVFDHGAQFFTVRDPRFAVMVGEWQQAGHAEVWSRGFGQSDGHARYRGVPTMTALPKHLATGLDVRLQTRATRIEVAGGRWAVDTEQSGQFVADALILTSLVPQSLALVGHLLSEGDRVMLEAITYEPCFAVMAILDGPSQLPAPGVLQLHAEPIAWIGDNQRKGVSPEVPAVTIHTGPQFSREHLEDDMDAVARLVLGAAREWLGAKIVSYQVHRWRYSRPTSIYPEPVWVAPTTPSLIFAGDAFGGPRIEGAALSGLAAGNALSRESS